MSAADLLARIEANGVAATLEPDGRIRLQPIDALPSELLAEAKARRDELSALLATRSGGDGRDRSDDPTHNVKENAEDFCGPNGNIARMAPNALRYTVEVMRRAGSRTEPPPVTPESPACHPAARENNEAANQDPQAET